LLDLHSILAFNFGEFSPFQISLTLTIRVQDSVSEALVPSERLPLSSNCVDSPASRKFWGHLEDSGVLPQRYITDYQLAGDAFAP
jgi:hypothetical protein